MIEIQATCTRCRDGPTGEVSGAIEPGTKRLEGQINSPKCQVAKEQRNDRHATHRYR